MKDLTKVFIDLSKCTEEQRNHIFSLLPEPKCEGDYEVHTMYQYLHYKGSCWFVDTGMAICNKTELTYDEFIKLFEGGEGTEVQKLKKQIDLYKECFELFIPTDKWDEANEFLSINNNPLAKHLSRVQKEVEKKPKF